MSMMRSDADTQITPDDRIVLDIFEITAALGVPSERLDEFLGRKGNKDDGGEG